MHEIKASKPIRFANADSNSTEGFTMRFHPKIWAISTIFSASALGVAPPLDIDFEQGVDTWRVVLDGVMGGRSSGRITQGDPDKLVFSGKLSLANNGGFSQIRTNIPEGTLADQDGIAIKLLGDGRSYQFDIRVSNVRLMAGGFQAQFDTVDGEWKTIELPFEDFRLYSFGRRVPRAPVLDPAKIESIGLTLADKKPGDFRVEIDSIRSYDASESIGSEQISNQATSKPSLSSVADSAGLSTLMQLIERSGIELPEGEQVTILAPSEAAFSNLPKETIEFLVSPDGTDTLQTILSNHVVIGVIRSNELLNKRSLKSLAGQSLPIELANGLSVAGARFESVDVEFDQGVVHVIDTVLVPESRSILDLAASNDRLSTLTAAIQAAGIGSQLESENGPWTVFAPVNSAFSNLPEGALNELLEPENRAKLIDTLGLHIIPGRIASNELLASQSARSYFGNKIEFSIKDGQVMIANAQIVQSDIQASNGVIHLIDAVIAPKKSNPIEQAAPTPARLNHEAVRLYELAISRGVPLFNAGQESACATIYEITVESMIALGADNLDRRGIEQLEMGMAEAESEQDTTKRAWIFRRALDRAAQRFSQAD